MIGGVVRSGGVSSRQSPEITTTAQPSTPAQKRRYRRMIDEATKMVLNGGDEALQMKEVAVRSGVALATLYRYFPSKRHLLLAIGISRVRDAQAEIREHPLAGSTTRERVAEYLLRHFRQELRYPGFRSLMQHAAQDDGPEYRVLVDEYAAAFQQNLTIAAGSFTAEQLRLLPIVIAGANHAASQCILGALSVSDVRFHILAASRLLELSADVVARDLMDAATDFFSSVELTD